MIFLELSQLIKNMQSTKCYKISLLLWFFICLHVNSQTLPIDSNIKYGKLHNGLSYYIAPNNFHEGFASFMIVSRACPILEDSIESGITHFVEHVWSKKSKNFPYGILPLIERHGGQFGYNIGGYTFLDHTSYYLNDITTENGMLDSCLLVLHDLSNYMLFTKDMIETEKKNIISEINTQPKKIDSYKNKVLLDGTIYAKMSILGNAENVENIKLKDIQTYYKKKYVPGLEAIIISGDVDPLEIEQKIKMLFSSIKGDSLTNINFPSIPDNKEPIICYTYRNNDRIEFDLSYKSNPLPKDSLKTKAGYRKSYIQFLSGEMMNMRIGMLPQKPNSNISEAWASYGIYLGPFPKEAWKINLKASKDCNITKIMEMILRENQRVIRYGFSKQELDDAKQKTLKKFVNNELNNSWSNYDLSNKCKEHFVRGTNLLSTQYEYSLLTETLASINLEDINTWIKDNVTDENISLFISAPNNTVLPSEEKMKFLIQKKFDDLLPYKYIVKEKEFTNSYPQKGKITEEHIDTIWNRNAKVLKLSNGAKVILFNVNNKDSQITIGVSAKGGMNSMSKKDVKCAELITKLTEIGGLGNLNAKEVKKINDERNIHLNEFNAINARSLVGSTFKSDVEILFQMLHLSLTAPHKDENAFLEYKKKLLTERSRNKNNSNEILKDTLNATIYNNRFDNISNTEIQLLDYDYLLNLRKRYYADIESFNFIIVGNINEDSIRPLIERYIASIPNQVSDLKLDTLRYRISNRSNKIDLDLGINTNRCTVFNLFATKMKKEAKSQYELAVFQSYLNKRYLENIRKNEGVYDVKVLSNIDITFDDAMSNLMVSFETSREKIDKLNDIVYDEIKKIAYNAPNSEIIENIKKSHLDMISKELKNNSFWRANLSSYYTFDMDMITEYEAIIRSITPEKIKEIAEKFINDNNRINIIIR